MWKLGDTSKKYESGTGGPGTVSTGKGDRGGVSYGTYQLSSNTGTVQKFIETMNLSDQFRGLTPGSVSFSQRWKKLAVEDSNFGEKQHSFIKQTHYIPQLKFLQKESIDFSKRGPAIHDLVWSTSVQFGPGTSLIIKALQKHGDVDKLTDEQIITIVQDYKIANVQYLFKNSSSAVRNGVLKRMKDEKTDLLKLANERPEVDKETQKLFSLVDMFVDIVNQ